MRSEYRPMRLVLMFDLPTVEKYQCKEYRIFHNELIKNGYIMMQFSIYIKTVNVQTKIENEIKKIKAKIPQEGNIRIMKITEKQYNDMYIILGNKNINELYNGPERFIKI